MEVRARVGATLRMQAFICSNVNLQLAYRHDQRPGESHDVGREKRSVQNPDLQGGFKGDFKEALR